MKKNRLLKAGFAVCTICLLVFVCIPIVNADSIVYPKEDGPYTVYIGGKIHGMGGSNEVEYESHNLPFWNINYPSYINYPYELLSIFIVNGKLQNIDTMSFPANIYLYGFKGFAPTMNMILLKLLVGRLRVVGICDEIYVWEN